MSLIPEEIGNVQLPKGKKLPTTLPAYPAEPKQVTAFALAIAVKNAGSATLTHLTKSQSKANNMVELRSQISDGVMRFRKLDPKRSQNAEAILIHVYGDVKEGAAVCAGCMKGNGPFTKCIQLVQGGACSNCHYNSGASKCTFYKEGKRTSTPSLTTPRKVKMSRAEADFLVMIRGIRPNQLKLLGNALLNVAEKLDDVSYDPAKSVEIVEVDSDYE